MLIGIIVATSSSPATLIVATAARRVVSVRAPAPASPGAAAVIRVGPLSVHSALEVSVIGTPGERFLFAFTVLEVSPVKVAATVVMAVVLLLLLLIVAAAPGDWYEVCYN